MKKNLFILAICCTFAAVFGSCTLFKVTAGRVTYTDPQRHLELTADTLTVVNDKRK